MSFSKALRPSVQGVLLKGTLKMVHLIELTSASSFLGYLSLDQRAGAAAQKFVATRN